MKISKILKVGDTVFSSKNGQPMKVTRIYSTGFDTEEDYFSFDEHRVLFYLTKRGYLDSVKNSKKEGVKSG